MANENVIVIKQDFGAGGAGIHPRHGKPDLATALRAIADDAENLAQDAGYVEETVPVASNVGLLLEEADIIEFVNGTVGSSAGPKSLVHAAATLAAGQAKVAADRRTVTFEASDAITTAIIGYRRRAKQAALLTGIAGTYVLADAETLLLKVDGGAEQTATFNTADFSNIALATAAEVAAVINADIVGATAEVRGGILYIRSDTKGPNSSLEETGGTAAAALGLDLESSFGTGVALTKG